MTLAELMGTKPETLAKKQYDALKSHVRTLLKCILNDLDNDPISFDRIKDRMCFSPAGDFMGTDQYFINFGYDGEPKDLMDVILELERLDEIAKKNDNERD